MLFCFGLFALLLYNTVVANAECSYTYRNSSQQHIEAQSSDYEKQGFQRCEFLIELLNQQQQLELNFTRLSGFSLHNASENGVQEGSHQEEEEEEEGSSRGSGRSREDQESQTDDRGRSKSPSHQPHVLTPSTTTPATHAVVFGSKLSSIVSSPTVPREQQHSPTHTHAHANTNTSSETVVETPTFSLQTTPVPHHGQSGGGQGRAPCLPMVEIREVTGEGQEKMRHRICREHHNTQTPIVFHYASSVRIVYEWKQRQSSGFTLYFDFSSSEYEKCVHKCDGSRCLMEAGLLCDGHADCHDHSDEGSPVCPHSTSVATSDPLEAGQLVQLVVIPTSLVVVGVVVCVVCLLARHRWYGVPPSALSSSSAADMQAHHHHHHHHHHPLRGNGHAAHLDCPQSHSSEGLTPSACSTQECSNEQAVALLPSTHRAHKSWQPPPPCPPAPDPEIGLPPNIPVSPDGEEGYCASQLRLLDRRSRTAHSELFKPPPNKTVFDRESPPPYSLTPSPGTYGCGSPLAPPPSPPTSLGRDEGYLLPAGPERVIRDSEGQPVVSRCYTMFSAPALPRLHAPGRRYRYQPPPPRCPDLNNGVALRHCDPSQLSPPPLHGAVTTVGDVLHPSPCPFPTSSPPGDPSPHPLPSQRVSPTSSSSGVGPGGRASDRRNGRDSGHADSLLPDGQCPPLGYQVVVSQGRREGKGGVGDSPSVAPVSPTSSLTSTTASSTRTSATVSNSGDLSGV